MRAFQHRGFTLIELLVVLAMLGMLAGIGVSAVMKVREATARVQCANNLRQLVIAAQNYNDTSGFIPSNPDTIPGRHGTLQDLLQPYLE